MASNVVHNLSVPTTEETDIAVYQVTPKAGRLNFLLFNNGEKIAQAGQGGMQPGSEIQLKVHESDDRQNWEELTADFVTISPGGTQDFGIISRKAFLKVTAKGTTGGGYVRVDIQHRGDPYFGQVDIDLIAKSGYGKDGDTPNSTNGVGVFGSDPWPE